jgi:uncharacterized OsmC-like protein
MNAEQLRALQAPLKARYREQPESALRTLQVHGRVVEGIACRIETRGTRIDVGLHPATGGSGTHTCSADLLLEALAGCAGVTLSAVATAIGIELRDAEVRVEGELDFRGTLAVSKDAPVGFRRIRVHFDLDTDATEEQLATLLKLTERYCVVFQTLRQPAAFEVTRSALQSKPGTRA